MKFLFFYLSFDEVANACINFKYFFSEKDKGCHATETEHIDLDFYIELKLKKKKSHLKITNHLTPRSD